MRKQYYEAMLRRGRARMFFVDDKLAAIATYLVGSDDTKYLFNEPWTIIADEPDGDTLYIQQLIIKTDIKVSRKHIHREFTKMTDDLKKEFPNLTQVKWVRAPASFRKKGLTGERPHVHYKSIR